MRHYRLTIFLIWFAFTATVWFCDLMDGGAFYIGASIVMAKLLEEGE